MAGVWLRDQSASSLPELLGVSRISLDALATDSDLVLLATSDRAIHTVAEALPATEAIVFHASGALAHVRDGFSLHPLHVLPPVGENSDLRDVLLVFEGQHREMASEIAKAIGARFAEIATQSKPLYHAAAVFGANYVAALLEIAHDLMSRAGVTGTRDDLARLATSAVENWRSHGDAGRFTGPAARGDREIVESHLTALHDRPEVADIYRLLAEEITRAILARSE